MPNRWDEETKEKAVRLVVKTPQMTMNLLTNRDTPLLKIKETGRYGRHGREQEERDKASKKV